ncbi:tyrosine-type recombinase/integrase [Cohnella sp. NL03-T5]|nr:tyrosine-type recombinase/integrase [Cohnella silvisoli]
MRVLKNIFSRAVETGIAHVKEPKTRASKRKVALPSTMLQEIKDYYLHKLDEREKIGDMWEGGQYNFMFCHPNGKAFHQERPYLWFRELIKKNKLRYIRFHELRHTSAYSEADTRKPAVPQAGSHILSFGVSASSWTIIS